MLCEKGLKAASFRQTLSNTPVPQHIGVFTTTRAYCVQKEPFSA